MSRLLVATPDDALRAELVVDARADGLEASGASTGTDVLRIVGAEVIDLVVLDDRLAGADIGALVAEIAQRHGGSIVLTSDAEEVTVVWLMDLGADDVLSRPLSVAELRARIHAVLRRRTPARPTYSAYLTAGPLCLHVATRLVSVRGQRLHLPQLEFAVLLALQSRDGVPVSRGVLLDECWPPYTTRRPQYVDAAIRRLRLRLEIDPSRPQHLLTVRSKGYALRP